MAEQPGRARSRGPADQGVSMRRTVLLLAMVMVTALVAGGAALAGAFDGDDANNRLVGTDGPDTMRGLGGDDVMRGFAGRDRLFGGGGDMPGDAGDDTMYGGRGRDLLNGEGGADRIYGGPGDDYISSTGDDGKDYVDCGGGTDTVNQELGTEPTPEDVYLNCERTIQ